MFWTDVMKNTKLNLVIPILTFIIGTIFGGGIYWQYKQNIIENEKLNIEHEKQSIDLRDKIFNSYNRINELSIRYVTISKKDKISELKKYQIKKTFELLSEDIRSYEKKLAIIEHRKPRNINFPYPFKDAPPSTPSNVSVKVKIGITDVINIALPVILPILLFIRFGIIRSHVKRNTYRYLNSMSILDIICFSVYLLVLITSENQSDLYNTSVKIIFFIILLALLLIGTYGLFRKRTWSYWLYYLQYPIKIWLGIYSFWFIYEFFDCIFTLSTSANIGLTMLCIFLETFRFLFTAHIHINSEI